MFEHADREAGREYTLKHGPPVLRHGAEGGKWCLDKSGKYYLFTSTFKLFIKLFIHKTKFDKIKELGIDNLRTMVAR